MRGAVITGTGSAVPSRIVTNAELSTMLGEDIDPFVRGTLGIEERHWCMGDESTADLAEDAARLAMEAAGVAPDAIDLLIVATDTPEFISPATASVLHGRLELTRAGTFDLNAGCAGFVTALDVAWKYIRSDSRYQRILVVGAYAMSKYLDQHDKKTVTIFADGAGAVVVEARDTDGILASELFADGRYCHGMGVFAGGTRTPISQSVLDAGLQNKLRFVQKYPASINEEGWPRIVQSVLGRIGYTPDDVDRWFWTQVNRSTIETVMQGLSQPMERAHTIMHKWGYTGSACLPMALDDAVRTGRVRDGELLMFTGSGAGLAMGSLAMRWHAR
ncbi:3-ketoacyl-ACP synthase [Gemmatimonas phototrophica]|uniref:3-ketoacyl-ACP synthase n=1 Tax=Gemmatimonas phototrophica TaxID=1379270 RepID=A0A145Q3N8_9BACT|nr:3-ketoacyl-ACP synthase [Gemmatimonas phototrophica]